MLLMFISTIMVFMVTMIMMMMNFLISKKKMKNREKMSPFECGFDPQSSSRMPFSLQFFLISIIFLIFDVEISLLIPMIFNIKFYVTGMYMILILLILLIGLFIEWKEGALKWFK